MELIAITETGHPAKQVGALPEIAEDVMKSTAEMYQSAGFQPPWAGYLAIEECHCFKTFWQAHLPVPNLCPELTAIYGFLC